MRIGRGRKTSSKWLPAIIARSPGFSQGLNPGQKLLVECFDRRGKRRYISHAAGPAHPGRKHIAVMSESSVTAPFFPLLCGDWRVHQELPGRSWGLFAGNMRRDGG